MGSGAQLKEHSLFGKDGSIPVPGNRPGTGSTAQARAARSSFPHGLFLKSIYVLKSGEEAGKGLREHLVPARTGHFTKSCSSRQRTGTTWSLLRASCCRWLRNPGGKQSFHPLNEAFHPLNEGGGSMKKSSWALVGFFWETQLTRCMFTYV